MWRTSKFGLRCVFSLEFSRRVCAAGRVPRDADYMVIDINHFPGFEKLPNYESMMVDFLSSLLNRRKETPPTLKKLMSFSQTPVSRGSSA